jgi:hypothetical protein
MALEDRVAQLESDMSQLKIGTLETPTMSSLEETIRSTERWAATLGCISIFATAFTIGVAVGDHVEPRNASHDTPASVCGLATQPGHDTVEDHR